MVQNDEQTKNPNLKKIVLLSKEYLSRHYNTKKEKYESAIEKPLLRRKVYILQWHLYISQ